jgi:hypothetical protein
VKASNTLKYRRNFKDILTEQMLYPSHQDEWYVPDGTVRSSQNGDFTYISVF